MSGSLKKYPLHSKTDPPGFNYLVRYNDKMDYYLFFEFNDALEKIKSMSLEDPGNIACLYEPYFNNQTREYLGQNTFTAYDGIVEYDKHARVELHLEFFVNAGEWLNPDIKLGR